jgi:hypothetical protein
MTPTLYFALQIAKGYILSVAERPTLRITLQRLSHLAQGGERKCCGLIESSCGVRALSERGTSRMRTSQVESSV